MSDLAAIRKQLKIKSGVVQRLTKEINLYSKEIDQLEAKRADFVKNKAEDWDIKNASKMIEESKKMVQDTASRQEKAAKDLQDLVTSARNVVGLAESEELLKADQVLAEATA